MKKLSSAFQLNPGLIAAVATFGILSASHCRAATILISDTLTSPTTTTIVGRTPDIADTPGTTYLQQEPYGTFVTTTTGATDNPASVGDAYLNFPTVTAGSIYTLTVKESGGNGGYAELAFDNTNTDTTLASYSTNGPAILISSGGSAVFPNGIANGQSGGAGPSAYLATGNILSLVLNTETPNWTLSAFQNGIDVSDYTFTTNPTGLNALVLANGGGGYVYTNLSLTEASASASVPEPSSWAYVGLGIGMLGLYLRRRTA